MMVSYQTGPVVLQKSLVCRQDDQFLCKVYIEDPCFVFNSDVKITAEPIDNVFMYIVLNSKII